MLKNLAIGRVIRLIETRYTAHRERINADARIISLKATVASVRGNRQQGLLFEIITLLSYATMSRNPRPSISTTLHPAHCDVSEPLAVLENARGQRRANAHAMDCRPLVRNYDHNTARHHRY